MLAFFERGIVPGLHGLTIGDCGKAPADGNFAMTQIMAHDVAGAYGKARHAHDMSIGNFVMTLKMKGHK